jgi:hypothetical protein
LKHGDGRIGDHCDRNPLNNRRCNLRVVPLSVNALNHKLRKNNKSGMNGVSWNKRIARWVATAWINGRTQVLGSFLTLNEAKTERERYNATLKPLFEGCTCLAA